MRNKNKRVEETDIVGGLMAPDARGFRGSRMSFGLARDNALRCKIPYKSGKERHGRIGTAIQNADGMRCYTWPDDVRTWKGLSARYTEMKTMNLSDHTEKNKIVRTTKTYEKYDII